MDGYILDARNMDEDYRLPRLRKTYDECTAESDDCNVRLGLNTISQIFIRKRNYNSIVHSEIMNNDNLISKIYKTDILEYINKYYSNIKTIHVDVCYIFEYKDHGEDKIGKIYCNPCDGTYYWTDNRDKVLRLHQLEMLLGNYSSEFDCIQHLSDRI